MAIFNSYVKLPEGIHNYLLSSITCLDSKKSSSGKASRKLPLLFARQFADRISSGALEMVVACPVDVEPSYPTKRVHFFLPRVYETYPIIEGKLAETMDEARVWWTNLSPKAWQLCQIPRQQHVVFEVTSLYPAKQRQSVSAWLCFGLGSGGGWTPPYWKIMPDHHSGAPYWPFFWWLGGHVGTRNHGGDGHFPNKERERERERECLVVLPWKTWFLVWYWISSFLFVILLTRNRICRKILFIQYTCYRHDIYIYVICVYAP